MITWVVGRGGLLGRAVARRAADVFDSQPVPWHDSGATSGTFDADARRFRRAAGEQPWAVVWAAGAATTSTSATAAAAELASLDALLVSLVAHRPAGPGVVFLTSSAGGVYAGSSRPPFDATTVPRALSPYGDLKLAQERCATERLAGIAPLVIGRLSNLYGPGQNLDKLQGLVSRLALSAVTRVPINIFVSLDTIRDYLYVDDAATAVLDAVACAAVEQRPSTTLVLASGQPATVGQLIRTMDQVTKRRVPVALGLHPSAAAQAADLRLVPTRPLDDVTPLPAGMRAVYIDILERVQQGSLVR